MSRQKKLLLLGAVLVIIDQVIKILVKTNMTLGQSIPVFGDWFQLLFVENKGMAFGMSFGGVVGKYLLTTFRIVLFGFLCWWIGRLCRRDLRKMGKSPVCQLRMAGVHSFQHHLSEETLGFPCLADKVFK